jgi:hypothetical protein
MFKDKNNVKRIGEGELEDLGVCRNDNKRVIRGGKHSAKGRRKYIGKDYTPKKGENNKACTWYSGCTEQIIAKKGFKTIGNARGRKYITGNTIAQLGREKRIS